MGKGWAKGLTAATDPRVARMVGAKHGMHYQRRISLGAGRWRTLVRVTLPLSLPGLLAGCLLVFASSVTAFVSQTIIGGGRMVLMPFYIWQQATTLFNWPFAATISMVLLVSVLAVVTTLNALGRRSRALVNG